MHLVLQQEEWLVGEVSFYLKLGQTDPHLQKRRLAIDIRS